MAHARAATRLTALIRPRTPLRAGLVRSSLATQKQQCRALSVPPARMDVWKPVFTADATPPVGPYSQAALTNPPSTPNTPQRTLYISGQLAATPSGTLLDPASTSIAESTTRICGNIGAILAAAGAGPENVVKTTVFLVDMADFKEMNGVYEQFFTKRPARSCVQVAGLPMGVKVEIECVAVV